MIITADGVELTGDLTVPHGATGMVVFAHGTGSSRHSPRNRAVASHLQQEGLATLLMDLLTAEEEQAERHTRHLRFDIELLAGRLAAAVEQAASEDETAGLTVGLFGASTGAAAALVCAADRSDISAVVSRGGRPDLAGDALGKVTAPTLLVVGGRDTTVLDLNRRAQAAMTAETQLEVIPGATHLFPEPGALERVAELAGDWFRRHLS